MTAPANRQFRLKRRPQGRVTAADFDFISPPAADRLLGAGVDKEHRGREKASDHAPTWVRLR